MTPQRTSSYSFIGFGAIHVTKPFGFIRFGAMDGPKPYELIIIFGEGGVYCTRGRVGGIADMTVANRGEANVEVFFAWFLDPATWQSVRAGSRLHARPAQGRA